MYGFMSTQLRVLGLFFGRIPLVAGLDLAPNAAQDTTIAPDNGSASSIDATRRHSLHPRSARNDGAERDCATSRLPGA